MSWQMEKSILFFFNYVYVTDVMSLGQMLLSLLFINAVIMVHDIIIEKCGCQGGHQALLLWAVIGV